MLQEVKAAPTIQAEKYFVGPGQHHRHPRESKETISHKQNDQLSDAIISGILQLWYFEYIIISSPLDYSPFHHHPTFEQRDKRTAELEYMPARSEAEGG